MTLKEYYKQQLIEQSRGQEAYKLAARTGKPPMSGPKNIDARGGRNIDVERATGENLGTGDPRSRALHREIMKNILSGNNPVGVAAAIKNRENRFASVLRTMFDTDNTPKDIDMANLDDKRSM